MPSSWTSRCRTSTPSSACRCDQRSPASSSDLGVTTIYVTHDQTEAMTMGDRVAVMRKGQLQQVDAPQALYEHPKNLFVAGFIGSPAMNLFEAILRVGEAASGRRVRWLPARRAAGGARHPARAPRLRRHARSPSASVPKTWRTRRSCPTRQRDRRITAVIELIEALGSDVLVHFTVHADPALTDDVKELALDIDPIAVETRGRSHERHRSPQPAHPCAQGRAHRARGRHEPAALLRPRGQLSHLQQVQLQQSRETI